MKTEEFKNEYDLEKLQIVTPKKRNFEMAVSSKYVDHYIQNAYENFTADLLLNLSKDNTFFIDIGAHFGFYTLLIGAKRNNNKIVAFEPVPENFEILKKNIELNDMKNVDVCNLAVSNKCETAKFNVAEHSCSSGFYHHPLSETVKTIDVEAVTIDDFLKGSDIYHGVPIIIKIDTEGHDILVLEGMKETLKNSEDVKLFIELNPKCLKQAGYQPEDLLEKVSQLGFDIYVIEDEYRETYKLTDIKKWNDYLGKGNYGRTYFNILCIKKEKSLSVCIFSHSSQLAGAERSLLELTTELIRDQGAICSVILPNNGPLKGMLEDVGVSTFVMNYYWWCDSNSLSEDEINSRLNDSFKILIDNMQKIRQINPDIILTNTMVIPWGCVTATIIGKPHIWFVREFGKLDHGLKFYIPLHRILDFIRDSSNLILTNSNAVRRELFGNSEDILTVYSYIDIPNVCRDGNIYFTREHATKLIIVGTIHESKGQEDAVLAIKELVKRKKDVELIIMGMAFSSEYLKELKEIIRHEHLEEFVRFLDFRDDPYSVIDQTDIVLVCSRHEAMGRVTLEAMLLKKAVIGANSGGTSELINEGFDGLLYEPRNYRQLADKIEYLIDNKEKIEEFGENGYQYVRNNFTKEKYGEKVYKLLIDLKDSSNPLASSQFTIELMTNFSSRKDEEIADLKTSLQEKNLTIADKVTELSNIIQTKDIKVAELNNIIQTKDIKVAELANDLNVKDSQMRHLETSLQEKINDASKFNDELRSIKQSVVWKSVIKCQKVIDVLLPHETRRRKFYDLGLLSVRTLVNEGLGSFWWKVKYYVRHKDISNNRKASAEEIMLPVGEKHVDICPIETKVSVVIPTKDAGYEFEYVLDKIKNQEGIKDIELIVIDSGSKDDTCGIAKKYGALLHHIAPEDFDHGKTRNLGAEKATGEFILFVTQDAMFAGRHLIYDMVGILSNDDKIAAVTCRQIPRSDADLMAGFQVWNHYTKFLGIDSNKIVSVKDMNISPMEKRKLANLSDSCCCIRKDMFIRYLFRINFAEDLDLGIRLLKDKFKLVYLYDNVIIHSHNRTSAYFFKASYTDSKVVSKIIENEPICWNAKNVNAFYSGIKKLYEQVNWAIYNIEKDSKGGSIDIISTFKKYINSKISKKDNIDSCAGDNTVNKLFIDIESIIHYKDSDQIDDNVYNTLLNNYMATLGSFDEYINGTAALSEDMTTTLYKLFSNSSGALLGNYVLFLSKEKLLDDKIDTLDKLLSKGV